MSKVVEAANKILKLLVVPSRQYSALRLCYVLSTDGFFKTKVLHELVRSPCPENQGTKFSGRLKKSPLILYFQGFSIVKTYRNVVLP